MTEIKFEMRRVDEKRKKKPYWKASRYDPIIDQFIAGGEELVEITVEDKDAPYVAGQLKKRIGLRELEIEASASGGFVYLEKVTTEPT